MYRCTTAPEKECLSCCHGKLLADALPESLSSWGPVMPLPSHTFSTSPLFSEYSPRPWAWHLRPSVIYFQTFSQFQSPSLSLVLGPPFLMYVLYFALFAYVPVQPWCGFSPIAHLLKCPQDSVRLTQMRGPYNCQNPKLMRAPHLV